MDLSTISHKSTTEITIYDPWGEPTDMMVEIYGRDTREYRQAAMEIARESKGKASEDETENARRGARFLLSAVKSWKNVQNNGKEIKPDSKEAIDLLARDEMNWFAQQINRAVDDRSLFFEKRASS